MQLIDTNVILRFVLNDNVEMLNVLRMSSPPAHTQNRRSLRKLSG